MVKGGGRSCMFGRVMRAGRKVPFRGPRVPLGTPLGLMRLRLPLTPSTPGQPGPFAGHPPQAQHAPFLYWLLQSIFTCITSRAGPGRGAWGPVEGSLHPAVCLGDCLPPPASSPSPPPPNSPQLVTISSQGHRTWTGFLKASAPS